MHNSDTNLFYSELPVFEDGLIQHLSSSNRFKKVPEDWHVIITDIKDSTRAIQEGMHQQVNLAATASIISALNIARSQGLEFPFFFGGDGATLLIPNLMYNDVINALSVYQGNVKRAFDFDLRVDEVPVYQLYEENQVLLVSKNRLSDKHTIPVVLGEGLLYADELIKEKRFELKQETDRNTLNLDGMECRWDAVKPSEVTKQVVCLLLRIQPEHNQATILSKVLTAIENIYGSYKDRRPISVKGLKLAASIERFKAENELKFGESSAKRVVKSIAGYAIGKAYLKRNSGKNYLKNLVELSDTLVINGMLNTVISGTEEQRAKLETELNDLEESGEVLYGMNICTESIMSCYVQDRINNHVHFIDGSEGGYTAAASVLKRKLSLQKN
ncbi:MAG: DUF3095 family protein [Balneolaceae bacterium]|nr:DUF3095 family protein [Balneolaceae bacterium]MBO6547792.1 DUF3095 family protein [Balneolaceae bacterium]MBO6648303.1 DUF3095 family protein [Balneolaceae bacterium]